MASVATILQPVVRPAIAFTVPVATRALCGQSFISREHAVSLTIQPLTDFKVCMTPFVQVDGAEALFADRYDEAEALWSKHASESAGCAYGLALLQVSINACDGHARTHPHLRCASATFLDKRRKHHVHSHVCVCSCVQLVVAVANGHT